MQSRSSGDQDNPLVPLHHRMRAFDRDLIRGGHYGRTNRPNTWLHRPSLRREDSPCQPGAVHTWHISEVTNEAADFRLGGQSGLNANVARTAAFDADHVRADAAELIRGSPDLIVTE